MPLVYTKTYYTSRLVENDPHAFYIYGDNAERWGKAGQACIRDHVNAIGIATKFAPKNDEESFFSDVDPKCMRIVQRDLEHFNRIWRTRHKHVTFYLPYDGLGTGLAELPTRAPLVYTHIRDFFARLAPDCPWPEVDVTKLKHRKSI